MAEPQDSATIVFEDLSTGLMVQYEGGLHEQFAHNGGSTTNRWFKPNKTRLTGKTYNIKNETKPMAASRVSNDLFATFPTPRAYTIGEYNIDIDETSGDNDLHRVATSIRVSHVDIMRAKNNPHEIVPLVQKLRRDALTDVDNSIAMHRWLDTNSTMATVDGDPVQNDTFFYGTSAAHTNQTSCRAKITSGSISYFTDGQVIDVYNSGGTSDFTSVNVLDVNAVDNSIAITHTADVANITTGDTLHLSGEYGNSLISMGEWWGGETTIYGVNRATAGNRWMIPTRTRVGETAIPYDPTMLNDAARALRHIRDENGGYVMFTSPEIMNDVIEKADEKTIIQQPTSNTNGPFATYGFQGFVYYHPSFGKIALESDPFCKQGIIRLIRVGDWGSIWGTTEQFEWLPGALGGIWERLQFSTTSVQKGMFYEANGYVTMCDWCKAPRRQLDILNISQ